MNNTVANLERKIQEEQIMLSRYEEKLRQEDDPRKIRGLEEEVERTRMLIRGYQVELAEQRAAHTPTPHTLARRPSVLLANAPYGLETALVGRKEERLILDDWYQRDVAHPLLAIIGLGGQGKSTLTWDWMQTLRQQNQAPPLVVWWSFYETDGTPDKLMATVLKHFGDDPRQFVNLHEAVSQFIHHLRQTPSLIVLDGAERLLRAYSSLAAAYQGDGAETELLEQARQCIDPAIVTFLTWLADPKLTQAKTVLTSRLMPRELEGRGGLGLAGGRRHDLTGLGLEDAARLFQTLGIRATRAEVQAVCEPLAYHPLSLRLLAGYAAHDPLAPNDLRAATSYDPTADLLGRRQHVLQRAYDSLPRRAQHLLSRLAAFRSSVDWEVVAQVMGGGQIRRDLELLERRGLVQRTVRQETQTSYDLHPIVRRYAYDRLADRAGIHAQLVGYFAAVPQAEKVNHLNDLLPTIELYHHLARAGRYDEARTLFRDRLRSPMYYQLGAYQQVIELLRVLFPDGEERLPHLTSEAAQAWTLNELANSYGLSGRPNSAVPLFELAANLAEKQGDKNNLAIGLGNLAHMAQLPIGALAGAAANLRRSISLCREIEDQFLEAVGHQEYGRLLATCGNWEQATTELDTALEQATSENTIQGQGLTWAYRTLAALLHGDAPLAATAAQEALRLADETARTRYPYELNYVQVYWLLGWAALAQGQAALAQTHLDEALRRCRAINLVELEPKILLALARLARTAAQDSALPHTYAAEARHIAERAGYVLDLADIHNFLAQLALDAGDTAAARTHAQQAHTYAWCDGPPYAYQPALDEADRLLADLSQ